MSSETLLGMADGISIHIDKITVWARSFRRHSTGSIVLLCANASEEELRMCHDMGITTIATEVDISKGLINHQRLEATIQFLEEAHPDLYSDTFLITDVFDVVFQGNPFEKLNFVDFDLFVGSEGIKVGQEPWNADNIAKLFPDDVEKCYPNDIVCSGVIAGKRRELISLYKKMRDLCQKSTDLHDIKDQAALIVLIANNEIPNLKILNLNDGWVVHCAVAGPTQFFTSWGFGGAIKERYGIPKMEHGQVLTEDGRTYDIVHQFNRVPEWESLLIRPYLQAKRCCGRN